MEGRQSGRSARLILAQSVALKTEKVDLRPLQQPGIDGPMRLMTGHAAFGLHRFMLKGERASFVGVTLETHLILSRGAAQLPGQESTVLIVAVATRP
jgi:hypothetical protein